MLHLIAAATAIASCLPLAAGHASIWHPSMWGFNVTDKTFPYDNRPVTPLTNYTFDKWWFHGHLDYPPHDGDVFELPAGKSANAEIACNKGATSFFASSEGGDIREPSKPNDVCPGSDPSEYHTTGPDDLKGCALAITYQSDVTQVKPEDFAVFSINQTCVWNRNTAFAVPAKMPKCPSSGCICAFFWIHAADSGGEQNYMNGFRCDVTGATSQTPIAKAQVPRRCNKDPNSLDSRSRTLVDTPGNCTWGAKQPFYWFQAERNNMFEGTYSPPFYLDLYNFKDGAQNDIFEGYYKSMPTPGPNQTALPILADGSKLQVSGVPSASGSNASSPASPTSGGDQTQASPSAGGSPSPSSSAGNAGSTVSPGADGGNPDPASLNKRCRSSGAVERDYERRSLLGLDMHRRHRRLDHGKRSTLWLPI